MHNEHGVFIRQQPTSSPLQYLVLQCNGWDWVSGQIPCWVWGQVRVGVRVSSDTAKDVGIRQSRPWRCRSQELMGSCPRLVNELLLLIGIHPTTIWYIGVKWGEQWTNSLLTLALYSLKLSPSTHFSLNLSGWGVIFICVHICDFYETICKKSLSHHGSFKYH